MSIGSSLTSLAVQTTAVASAVLCLITTGPSSFRRLKFKSLQLFSNLGKPFIGEVTKTLLYYSFLEANERENKETFNIYCCWQ